MLNSNSGKEYFSISPDEEEFYNEIFDEEK